MASLYLGLCIEGLRLLSMGFSLVLRWWWCCWEFDSQPNIPKSYLYEKWICLRGVTHLLVNRLLVLVWVTQRTGSLTHSL